jgi:hypothetical protein
MTPDLAARLRSASKADGNRYELCLSVAEVRQIMHQLDELERLKKQVEVDGFVEAMRKAIPDHRLNQEGGGT